MIRTKRKALLNIDQAVKLNETFNQVNYVGYGDLITNGYLRIGGYRKLPFGFNQHFYHGFQGCIKETKIDDRIIDLVKNNINKLFHPNSCN